MTTGRGLYDIHIVLYLVAHWEHLHQAAKNYIVHHL
jgi:hypothetical protein